MGKHLLRRNLEALPITAPLGGVSVFAHGYGPAEFLAGVLFAHGVWSLAVVLAFSLGKARRGCTGQKP